MDSPTEVDSTSKLRRVRWGHICLPRRQLYLPNPAAIATKFTSGLCAL